MSRGNFINGQWNSPSGEVLKSVSPSTGDIVWEGKNSTDKDVDQGFAAARSAFMDWSRLSIEERTEFARRFQEIVKENIDQFAKTISLEMGKPLWEAKTEAAAVAGKVDLAIDALKTRRDTTENDQGGTKAVTRYKPHGVLGVLGPFNLPAHLPNGHIVPAILAGNTVVFKPSELTPMIAETMMGFWEQASLPNGVVNLVQGSRDTGIEIMNHEQLDGLLFTGSSKAGVAINQALAAHPQKIVALEMGGNNPLIVHDVKDKKAAAYETVLSAFITSGQRCTCARRLIVVDGTDSDEFINELTNRMAHLRVGYFDDESEPFIGPVINVETGKRIQAAQAELMDKGAKSIVGLRPMRGNDALLSPGLLDVTGVPDREDEEIFGPILQLYRVESFPAAIELANQTRYGLSAGLLSDSAEHFETFIRDIRAGVVNWNRQTTGASGKLPFGGCGLSGNHRPSGYFAADYCSFPVASLEVSELGLPETFLPGIG